MQTELNDAQQEHFATHARPKSGKTARVWEIADVLTSQTKKRARRKDVIRIYASEGGNPNTASTQYSQWHKSYKKRTSGNMALPTPGNVLPIRLTIGNDGRLLIPALLREAMLLDKTNTVTAQVVNGELRVLSPACAITQLQNLIASSDKGTGSVVDELINERRAEAKREAGR